MSMPPPYPNSGFLNYRQAAQAIGISVPQLRHMQREGEATPTYQLNRDRGDYLWSVAEVKRVRDMTDKKHWRRRRNARVKQPFDALRPVVPRVKQRGRLPPPPP